MVRQAIGLQGVCQSGHREVLVTYQPYCKVGNYSNRWLPYLDPFNCLEDEGLQQHQVMECTNNGLC